MADSGEVVWIDVLPSLRRFGATLAKEAAGAGRRTGEQLSRELDASAERAGTSAGKKLSAGLETAKANVKKIGDELAQARDKEADAAGKVRVAEALLTEARNKGTAKASQLLAAEERLNTAQRNHASAQARITSTTERYGQAQRNAADATDAVRVNTDRATLSMKDVEKKFASANTHVDNASRSMLKFGVHAVGAAAAVSLVGNATFGIAGMAGAVVTASGAMALLPAAAVAGGVAVGTLVLGLSGMGDAMKAVASGDSKKLEEAMRGLAPAARDVVREFAQLKPEFVAMKQAVQGQLFRGVAGELKPLADTYLPMARTQLGFVAAGYNAAAIQALKFAGTNQTVADLNGVLGNSGVAVNSLSQAAVNLIPALRDVVAVGAEFFPGLTSGAAAGAAAFSEMIARMRESGQLRELMAAGLDALHQLGVVAGNVGSILASIFAAASAAGGGLLGTLGFLTGQLAAFFDSPAGATALNTLFTTLHEVVVALAPGLHAVLEALAQGVIALGPALPPVAAAFSTVAIQVAPLIVDLANLAATILPMLASAIQFIGPALGPLVAMVFTAVYAFKAWQLVMRGMVFISTVIGIIRALTTAQIGLNVAMSANVIGLIVIAIAALVAGFIYLWNHSAGFRLFWIGLWEAIKNAAIWTWERVLKPVFSAIGAAFLAVGAALAWVWSTILEPIFGFIGKVLQVIGVIIFTLLVTPFVIAFNVISTVAGWLWNTILKPYFDLWIFVFGLVGAAMLWVWETLIKPAWDAIVVGATWLWTTILKPYFDAWIFVFGLIGAAVMWVWNTLIKPAWDAISAAASWLWDTVLRPIFDAWTAAFRAIGDALAWAWDNIIKPIWDAIGAVISGAWEHVIRPVFDWFKDRIDGVAFAFEVMKEVIKRVFDAVIEMVKKPIQLVIDIVWNNGIRKVYNLAAGLIPGMDQLPELRLSRGGVLPGYGPGRDVVPALLSPGEAVLVPELVRAMGPATILAANAAAMGSRRYSRGGIAGRFADGGIVGPPAAAGVSTIVTATTPDPTATTVAIDLLNVASAALAVTVTTILIPALMLLELHAGLLAVLAIGLLQEQLPILQAGINFTAVTVVAAWAWMTATTAYSVSTMDGYFGTLRNGLNSVGQAFQNTAGWVASSWGAIREYAAGPVRAAIAGPFDKGLIAAWNFLDNSFGLGKHLADIPIAFATGGRVPGYGVRDTVPAMLMPGEYVFSKKAIANMGGLPTVDTLHRMAAAGMIGNDARLGGSSDGHKRQNLMSTVAVDDLPMHFAYGGVQPHVAAAGDEIVRLFGSLPGGIGGVGSRPNASDHPAGLALDFMTLANKSLGDKIAGHLIANSSRLLVKYLIWQQKINQGSGWEGMENRGSITANHFDHVHTSFEGGGGGKSFSGAGMIDPVGAVNDAFANTFSLIDAFSGAYPGNLMAGQASGIARQAADRLKQVAIEKISASQMGGTPGSGPVVEQVRAVAAKYGWGQGPQWNALDWLLQHESSWNPNAKNPASTAYGLFQFLDSTWGAYGSVKTNNPALQAEAGMKYISARYRDPLGAQAFWQTHHWYDEGGWVQPGFTPLYNGTGKPELVLPHENAQQIIGALHNDGPVRLTGELSISGDGMRGYVDGRIEQQNHATGDAISRGVRI